ncbi:MAG TPA: hypothetical protein VLL48_04790 [Longimicrobiales bacterium]|nr:hypothetical protein [Longimicrobiales bacterium]
MRLGERTFLRLDLGHPEIEARILEEISAGVDVYYDRLWPFTRAFCRTLLRQPDLVAGRDVLVVGAGVGLEAVVVGRMGGRPWINDRAPVALELCRRQLRENGVDVAGTVPGSFADLQLPPVDVVVACFVVYDEETRRAARALERTAGEAGVPLLLGGEDVGGHLTALLEDVRRPLREIPVHGEGEGRIVLIGDGYAAS